MISPSLLFTVKADFDKNYLKGLNDIGLMFINTLKVVLAVKKSACQCRKCRFDPWVRKIPGGRHCNPLQYS